jgi:hypothetical protein
MKYLISYVLPMLAGLSQAAWAQDTERQGSASDPEDTVTQPEGGVLDLTLRDNGNMDAFDLERCDEEIDAATVSRTIIVCRKRTDAAASGFEKEKWEKDYAKRTQGQQPVEVAGEGITGKHAAGGGGTIRGCLPGLQKCPPPPALIIDVTALPQAPAGSDADRIARGLPPIGNDTGDRIPTELETKRDETSPAESEEPAGGQ